MHYVNVPLSKTLAGIRVRVGYSVSALAQYLEVDPKRIAEFEAGALPDQELLDRYGELARRRMP